jgi:RecB family exonuclease
MSNKANAFLTHSRMACAKACLRRHYYAFEMGLRPARESTPLRMGGSFHRGVEAFSTTQAGTFEEAVMAAIQAATAQYETVPQGVADPLEWAIERVTVERLLHAYFLRYQNDGLNVVATEPEFNLPLRNPETGAESRIFRLAGKIDRIVQLSDGRLAVLETKTTSSSLDDGSDYWARLRLDSQISLYLYAARQLGFDVATVLYDVVRKPEISVYRATPPDRRKYTKDGHLYANQREKDETPDEFAERLSADIAARPEFYFARKEIPRLEADLAEAQAEWWQQAQMLRECQRTGRWFRNTQSCLQPFRCEFTEVCFTGARPEESLPPGFTLASTVHPELTKGDQSDGTRQSA